MRKLVIMPQYQDLAGLYHYLNIDITARTQVVESMFSLAENLFYLGDEEAMDGQLDNLIIESAFPNEILTDANLVEEIKRIYYRTIYFLLTQLNILDLPTGVKYVYSMDEYKIVLEISEY